MDEGDSAPARYRAFISYSHQDAAAGRRLHRRLERYVLPKRLVGRITPRGPVPCRLGPIFRDREDLPAADNLSEEVQAALAGSACLIVVCSPAAKLSLWVTREVELFRSVHPGRPVLAALIAGTPADAFPDNLAGTAAREPLAADLQPAGDGPRLGFLKLVAGVVGVGLDELVQRDIQRRLRIVTAVTATALAGMLAMALLTATAIGARREAERQRADVQGLIEFMLTDLRDKLEGVGRLDALDAVNARIESYYEEQDPDRQSPEQREWRARMELNMGGIFGLRGRPDKAMELFERARRTTAAQLAADPDNLNRVFAHGQSEQAIGAIALESGRLDEARRAFQAYRALSERLVEREPGNAVYRREVGFAFGNLCSHALAASPRPAEESETEADTKALALAHCQAALVWMEKAVAATRNPDAYGLDLANRHAWLADAWRANQNDSKAREHRLAEEAIVRRLMALDPENMKVRQQWAAVQRALAALDLSNGRSDVAQQRLESALEAMNVMVAHEPANKMWAARRRTIIENLGLVEQMQREKRQ